MRSVFTLLSMMFAFILPMTSFAASIWQVTGERTFYLFGTIHILPEDAYPLPSAYTRALSQCDRLWVEVDTNELADQAVLQSIQAMMVLPAGQSIEDQLSIQAYSQLKELAAKTGVPMSALTRFKPWAAINQLTLMLFEQQGFNNETGLDIYLQAQAEKRKIPISAFETAQWQISLFDALGTNYPDAYIEFSTKDTHNPEQMISSLYRQWENGDAEQLYRDAEFENFTQIEDAVLSQRNNAWMKTLLNQSAAESHCAAVGALHMGGPNGLLTKFRKAGYHVAHFQ